jgi:hypothetical protein
VASHSLCKLVDVEHIFDTFRGAEWSTEEEAGMFSVSSIYAYLVLMLIHVAPKIELNYALWLRDNALLLLLAYEEALASLNVPEAEHRVSVGLLSVDHFAVLGRADRFAVDVAGPGLF